MGRGKPWGDCWEVVGGPAHSRRRTAGRSEGEPLKILFIIFLGILVMNAVVILAIGGILLVDNLRSRGKESDDDVPANAS